MQKTEPKVTGAVVASCADSFDKKISRADFYRKHMDQNIPEFKQYGRSIEKSRSAVSLCLTLAKLRFLIAFIVNFFLFSQVQNFFQDRVYDQEIMVSLLLLYFLAFSITPFSRMILSLCMGYLHRKSNEIDDLIESIKSSYADQS